MLRFRDKVGIISCSNGLPFSSRPKIEQLCYTLYSLGLIPVCSSCLYTDDSGVSVTPQERAESLMSFFYDQEIRAIFDVSGGDIANQMLDYLDFTYIRENPKLFFGYSDLTTLLNALYTQSDLASYLYQVRNLISSHGPRQRNDFLLSLLHNKSNLYEFSYEFVQGREMSGTIIGGNIRCFLKLAGTPYLPDFTDKILFLEARSGNPNFVASCLTQLKHLGAFDKARGILLGTFNEMENSDCGQPIEEILLHILENTAIPVAKTPEIGHLPNSKCLMIGQHLRLKA